MYGDIIMTKKDALKKLNRRMSFLQERINKALDKDLSYDKAEVAALWVASKGLEFIIENHSDDFQNFLKESTKAISK